MVVMLGLDHAEKLKHVEQTEHKYLCHCIFSLYVLRKECCLEVLSYSSKAGSSSQISQ